MLGQSYRDNLIFVQLDYIAQNDITHDATIRLSVMEPISMIQDLILGSKLQNVLHSSNRPFRRSQSRDPARDFQAWKTPFSLSLW